MRNVSYNYHLHPSQIALKPASPRDTSRLLVYDTVTDRITLDHFFRLHLYLPALSHLVVNETTVAPCRVSLFKQSMGKVVCLVLLNEPSEEETIRLMSDRKLEENDVLSVRSKQGTVPLMRVIAHVEHGVFLVKLLCQKEDLLKFLTEGGAMPLPPYLRDTPLSDSDLKRTYQTTFAKPSVNMSSVAAPTASLHFTKRLFKSISRKGIGIIPLRLEVGLGTFAPLTEGQLSRGELHTEWYRLPVSSQKNLLTAKKRGEKLIAVGTTSARTLESAHVWLQTGEVTENYHSTSLFIRPGYRFHMVDGLITNFHLPNSSLMMLVEALLQEKKASKTIIQLYQIAKDEGFRFYSFGDAMLIL